MTEYMTLANGDLVELSAIAGMEGKYLLTVANFPTCWGTYAECIQVLNRIQERVENIY